MPDDSMQDVAWKLEPPFTPRLPGHMLGAGRRAQHVEASVARILQDNLKTHSSRGGNF